MAKNEVRIPVIIDDKGSMKQTAKGAHSVDRRTKGAAKASSNASKNFSKMSQGITGGLVPAYATLAASLFAVDAVYRALSSAADLRILVQGQEAFAAKTGIAMRSVTNAVMEATDAQISFKEASQATAIGMAAGINGEQMTRLAKAATSAAKVLGRSVPDAFDRMTRGVIKAEPEVLDELGIILRLDTATENYAIKMGIAANSLTVFEKSQAVLNEVLTQAEGKYGDVADSIQPNTWTQLGVALEKVKDSFAIFASKVLEPVASFLAGNAMAAVGAVLIFVSSIMKGLIPSYAEQAAKFAESQGIMQAEIAETEARIMSLKSKQSGITETGGMALGGAQKMAMGATKVDGRTTLGKLQRGKVISARQANAEIVRLEKNKITKIDGMTKKHFKQYKIHLKTLAGESKMTGKKMEMSFELVKNKVKVTGLQMKTAWQATMRGMQRVTSAATRAMSLAMSAMGWISMIFMVVAAVKAWRDSTKEVDEAQKLLDDKIKTTTDSLNKLNAEQELIFEKLDETKKAWRDTGDAISYFANAVNSIPAGTLLERLMEQGEVVNADFQASITKTSENLANLGIGFAKLTGKENQKQLREYINLLGNQQMFFNQAKASIDAITNSEQKLQAIQKKRTETALKYQYKDEIDALMSIVEAEIKKAKVNGIDFETDNKHLKLLQDILKVESELAKQKQIQANAAWRSKNAYGAQAKDIKATLQAESKRAQMELNTKKYDQSVINMGDISKDPVAKARLEISRLQMEIDNDMLEAEAQVLLLGQKLSTQITTAMTSSFESGLATGLSNMIQGKGSFKDLLMGVGQAMAKAMADAMAKNLANKLTGFIMPEDPRDKIIKDMMTNIQIKQTDLNDTATKLHEGIQKTIEEGASVQAFDKQLNIVGKEFLDGLRKFFIENGLMKGPYDASVAGKARAAAGTKYLQSLNSGEEGKGNSESNPVITEESADGIKKYGSTFDAELTKLKDGLGGIFGMMQSGGGRSPLVSGIGAIIGAMTGATGGYVTKGGIQGYSKGGKLPGTYTGVDSVPAMLAPGEYVLTPSQMAGISGNNTVVNVNMTDSGAQTTTTGDAQALGRVLSIAVNKEIMKQKRPGGHLYQGGPGGI